MKSRHLCAAAWVCASILLPSVCAAGGVLDRVNAGKTVRVCIWPDYYGVTFRNPRNQQLAGIDIDLSGQLAKDLGVGITLVDSSFPKLVEDLQSDRCDVAMFAIGVLPARQAVLRFTQPYMQSDIYGVTTRSNRQIKSWSDIDHAGVQVAVQAGTFMEPVMAEALKQARMVVVKPPMTREGELEAGRVDVFMTDYPYSKRLLDNADWARLVPPVGAVPRASIRVCGQAGRRRLVAAHRRLRRAHQARRASRGCGTAKRPERDRPDEVGAMNQSSRYRERRQARLPRWLRSRSVAVAGALMSLVVVALAAGFLLLEERAMKATELQSAEAVCARASGPRGADLQHHRHRDVGARRRHWRRWPQQQVGTPRRGPAAGLEWPAVHAKPVPDR